MYSVDSLCLHEVLYSQVCLGGEEKWMWRNLLPRGMVSLPSSIGERNLKKRLFVGSTSSSPNLSKKTRNSSRVVAVHRVHFYKGSKSELVIAHKTKTKMKL